MKSLLRRAAFFAFLPLLGLAALMLLLQGRGVSARPEPSGIETRAALFVRSWMTPPTFKGLKNPVSATEENFLAAREHYADHCASCHANDGSGNTGMGKSMFPPAPPRGRTCPVPWQTPPGPDRCRSNTSSLGASSAAPSARRRWSRT